MLSQPGARLGTIVAREIIGNHKDLARSSQYVTIFVTIRRRFPGTLANREVDVAEYKKLSTLHWLKKEEVSHDNSTNNF
jgi:hypothetical protein